MVKELEIKNGIKVILDDDDYNELKDIIWRLSVRKKKYYYPRTYNSFMHRIICKAKKGEVVDHINGNTLDNRKENLRIVSYSQNVMNSAKQNNCASKYKGVTKTSKNRWQVHIGGFGSGKKEYIGSFKSETMSALAYDVFAMKRFGEYAKLNYMHLKELIK